MIKEEKIETGKRLCDEGSRDRREASTGQSTMRKAREPPEAGRGKEGPSPRAFREERGLDNILISDFWPPEQ